jgi:lysyl-tRNA synthetase class 2
MSVELDHLEQRREKLQQIEDLGHDPYPHKFSISHPIAEIVGRYSETPAEELEEQQISVRTAGRLTAIRGHGKASFGHLSGGGRRLQIYVRQDRVGEGNYQLYKLLDVGDHIGVSGTLARTRTDELTVFVDKVEFLSKALLPLPEKWHGLADVETRYRQRYLDLIANADVRELFIKRSRLIAETRCFLEGRGYLEVETPMMHPVAGGAVARPFKTFHEALGIPLYLRIAPELYLKRLIVGGYDKVYEINRNFRNEGISTQHNPEFTMLEFYQAFSDYHDLMDLTEELLHSVVEAVNGSLEVEYKGMAINFGAYRRLSMVEAIQEYWPGSDRPDAEELADRERVLQEVNKLGAKVGGNEGWGKLLGVLFETVVEQHLIQPTFIYDFPMEVSPLSKQKESDPRFVERFELFAAGLELANAYSELNDPEEQRRRFEQQLQERARGDLEAHEMDEDYVTALLYGMPPTAGEGIGIDRLAMILTGSPSIREVILFPHLRPVAKTK